MVVRKGAVGDMNFSSCADVNRAAVGLQTVLKTDTGDGKELVIKHVEDTVYSAAVEDGNADSRARNGQGITNIEIAV